MLTDTIELAFYGTASAATIGFAALSRSDRGARTAAATALFLLFLAANQTRDEDVRIWWIVLDGCMMVAVILSWVDCPRKWKAHLYGLYMAQMACHVVYYTALHMGGHIGYAYTAALNLLFLCQLWTVGGSGVKRAWNDYRNWFPPARVWRMGNVCRASYRSQG